MKVLVVTKKVDELSEVEYNKCLSLSYRGNGNLYYDLYRYRKRKHRGSFQPYILPKKPAWVIMIKNEEKEILAWCLMAPDKPRGRYVAQFWTRRAYRGRGFGTKLMQEALKIDPKPWVYPHDTQSAGLFKKYKKFVRYEKMYSEVMQ